MRNIETKTKTKQQSQKTKGVEIIGGQNWVPYKNM